MSKSFVKGWIDVIRPLFPKNARIIEKTAGDDDVVLEIDWKLGNDPSRPNKRSRLIRVVISELVITDCRDFKIAGSRFETIIRDRLSVFKADHETPKYSSSPVEEWVISTFDVNYSISL